MPECRGGIPERCGAYGLYRDTERISFSNPEDAWPCWGEGIDIACNPVECGVMICGTAGGAGAKIGGLLVSFFDPGCDRLMVAAENTSQIRPRFAS